MTHSPHIKPYHHGNLRDALLDAAERMIETQGIEQLSLRNLAKELGVSRSALYHHFVNKQALLAAIAQAGFGHLNELISISEESLSDQAATTALNQAIKGYLEFAQAHPAQYELMFGKALWVSSEQQAFQRYAKDCFRHYVLLFERLQFNGQLKTQEAPLRLAQLMWASLHGLARLINDGIIVPKEAFRDLAQTLLNRFI